MEQSFSLNSEQRTSLLKIVLELLEGYYSKTKELPVSPELDVKKIKAAVAEADFENPLKAEEAIRQLISNLKEFSVHTPHPKYFGLFNPRASFPSILGDLITSYFNPQMAAWSHSPFINEAEAFLIRSFGKKFGFPSNSIDGVFANGGAEANLTALVCALNHQIEDFGRTGLFGLDRKPVLYCSEEAHHSVHKAAKTVGLGHEAVRNIAVDNDLKMDLTLLENVIKQDLDMGYRPFMLIATGGTTGTGSIDDLVRCGQLAKQYNLWFHVDAAYGGAAALDEKLASYLNGIAMADSITFDAHKWLSVGMGTSLFLTRHPNILSKSFGMHAEYMPKEAKDMEIVDPFSHSLQWSRRAIGLKLYLSLMVFGWEGFQKTIQRQTEIGDFLKSELKSSGWQILNDTPFPVCCFQDPEYLSESNFSQFVLQRILSSGKSWLSLYPVHGVYCFRACITNYETNEEDIKELVSELAEARIAYQKRKLSMA